MAVVKVQLNHDESKTLTAEAASAKVEGAFLILRDEHGNETGRFAVGKIENWWSERQS